MKVCGVIAEYNPFHNGHKLQLQSAVEKSKADICVVVMSGMFTQRGDIAIASKFVRAQTALSQGADIVIELPTCYALQPAEYFALGGVGILNGLGADFMSFGTEAVSTKDRNIIDDFVSITNSPSTNFEHEISINIKNGLSYPQSRIEAFKTTSNHIETSVLKRPNAMLEIAYRNALHRLNSSIIPIPVPRVGDAYHDASPKSTIASATAIRNLIKENKDYSSLVPTDCYNIIDTFVSNNLLPEFNLLYPYLIHSLATAHEIIKSIPDGNDELYNRMIKAIPISHTMNEFILNVSTKRFSSARVSRAVMHIILNVSANLISDIRNQLPLYARVLGVREEKKHALGFISKQSSIPIFTSVANHSLKTELEKKMLDIDIAATNLFNLTLQNNYLYNQDYTQKLTIC